MDAIRFASREGGVNVYFPEGKTFSVLSDMLAEKLQASARYLEKRSGLFCLDDMGFSPEERLVLAGCIRNAYPDAQVIFGAEETEAAPAFSQPPEPEEQQELLPSPKRVSVGRYAQEEGELLDDTETVGKHAQAQPPVKEEKPAPAAPEESDAADAVILHTLRGGECVEAAGNVLVCGSVNPGARITAGGHVMVMGTLAGSVHAGANGNAAATVSALHFKPQQLRIAAAFWNDPARRRDTVSAGPELARLNADGQVELVPVSDRL